MELAAEGAQPAAAQERAELRAAASAESGGGLGTGLQVSSDSQCTTRAAEPFTTHMVRVRSVPCIRLGISLQ